MSSRKSIIRRKFTRTPKAEELIQCGVPTYAFPTYHALADHADNKTGKTRVSVERLAGILKLCRRTVERHLSALEAAGVIRRQHQRRTRRGRFSSCICVVIAFALFASSATVRHEGKDRSRRASKGTKPYRSTPQTPQGAKSRRGGRREAMGGLRMAPAMNYLVKVFSEVGRIGNSSKLPICCNRRLLLLW